MDPRQLKAKCLMILQNYGDLLTYISEEEIRKLSSEKVIKESEYETLKSVFMIEGIKEGMRRMMQKMNEYAAKDV